MSIFGNLFKKKRKRNHFSDVNLDAIGELRERTTPRFQSVNIRNVSIPFDDYLTQQSQTAAYMELVAATDTETAKEVAYRIYIGIKDAESSAYREDLSRANLQNFIQIHDHYYRREAQKAEASKEAIDQMFLLALQGTLRRQIIDPRNQAELNWGGGLAVPEGSLAYEISTAVDWATGSSATLRDARNNDVRVQLRTLMHDYVSNRRDLFDADVIDGIDECTGKKGFVQRPLFEVGGEAEYGGTVMGRHLQDYVIYLGESLRHKGLANPLHWIDVAAFMMVGHIRAQAYPDANHRLSSILYACILLQNGQRFVAPNYTWMHRLRTRPTQM